MLVQGIRLEGVKCFAKGTDIDLFMQRATPHRWVVIYGDNGLGKSTLLRAFGIALTGQPALNPLLPNAKGWVREGFACADIIASIQSGPRDKGAAHRQRPANFGWVLVGPHPYERWSTVYAAHSIHLVSNHGLMRQPGFRKKDWADDARLFKEHIATDEPRRGWLLCGYGPHRRLSGSSSDLSVHPDGRAARLVTLFHEKAALTSAEPWLRTLHHYASIDKTGAAQRRLDAIVRMINTGLLHGGVELHEITPEGVYFKTPFSLKIPMDDLSDGYRTVLALTLDLLRHVEQCFDIEEVLEVKADGRSVVTAEGVVLIDEIDAHLHPTWQRAIGPWLHARFPNMQFIVATHSPLIATRVSETEGMVIRLVRRKAKGKGKGEVVEAITEEGASGLTVDQRLTSPDFGLSSTRDLLADEKLAEIERLRERVRKKLAKPAEKKRLRALEDEWERIAPAAPDFAGVARWREDEAHIRKANEEAAREEAGRR